MKVCHGVILLLFRPEGERQEKIPLAICDVHTGQEIAKMVCKRDVNGNSLQIMEQFNEYLLVKLE